MFYRNILFLLPIWNHLPIDVQVVNVSIRHAHKDPGAYLAWARKEVFALVLYYKQGVTA